MREAIVYDSKSRNQVRNSAGCEYDIDMNIHSKDRAAYIQALSTFPHA